ncbi:MAG TPA: hypothetical protein VIK78_04565 [Ruminiclostridium sp.]
MNTRIQKYKDNFLKQQQITYRRTYVSESENEKLTKKYNKSESDENEIKKNFKVEEDSVVIGRFRFYTEQSETVTEEEISQYISMKIINRLDSLDEKINTMKGIMIFWVVLTIIGMIGTIFIAGR